MGWQIASSPRQMAGSPSNLHTMVPSRATHPGCAQGQGRGQRSRDIGTIVISQKLLLLPKGWIAINLHRMVPTLVCIQDVLKVKVEVKVHVMRAFL